MLALLAVVFWPSRHNRYWYMSARDRSEARFPVLPSDPDGRGSARKVDEAKGLATARQVHRRPTPRTTGVVRFKRDKEANIAHAAAGG